MTTSFTDRLSIEYPLVQAGMGGGIAQGELAGAVSAAGALGTVGILPPAELERELKKAREIADGRAISANLLVPFARAGHCRACARAGTDAVVLHGGFNRDLAEQLKAGGALVLGTVGTPAEATRVLAEGADAIIVQGLEAGGHLVGVEPAMQALERVLRVSDRVPVLLAGGIAERADVERALDAGATAAIAGTRFLLTHECAAHSGYKRAVLDARRTIETQLFGVGWPMRHRVVPNAATERWCGSERLAPRGVGMLQSLSAVSARLPLAATRGLIYRQRPAIPLFGPMAPLEGMPDRLIEAAALYAGETALRIYDLVSARDAVGSLVGATPPQ